MQMNRRSKVEEGLHPQTALGIFIHKNGYIEISITNIQNRKGSIGGDVTITYPIITTDYIKR